MTQHRQGFMNWNVERAVCVQELRSAEPDSSNTGIWRRSQEHGCEEFEL